MIKRFFLFLFLVVVFVIACTKDDEDGDTPYELDRIEFTTFKILDNSSEGITNEAKVLIDTKSEVKIFDHGVFLLKD